MCRNKLDQTWYQDWPGFISTDGLVSKYELYESKSRSWQLEDVWCLIFTNISDEKRKSSA